MITPAASLTPTAPPAILRTPRLELRTHDIAFAEQIFACIDADRERLARFLPWVDHLRTVDDERAYITRTHADREAGRMFDYGIFLREGDTHVGNVGVHHLRWEHAGCGIGSRCAPHNRRDATFAACPSGGYGEPIIRQGPQLRAAEAGNRPEKQEWATGSSGRPRDRA